MRKSVKFSFEANYYQSGTISEVTEEMWFVLHGYGQLPQYFLEKFRSIASDKRVIIAPGGLSRFYLEGFSGRVGSTWMTREERELDINNYVNYLHAVLEDVYYGNSQCKITLLGFSQGAATVTRWVQNFKINFDRLILWSGAFPHDMEIPEIKKKLENKEVLMIRGDKDSFINEEKQLEQQRLIKDLDIKVYHKIFAGGHDIDTPTLESLL
ncbi:alpha/beta hydrolase [Marivirga sp. S37H4]|uniref:Alpha/beta hydrolase n=1 Tax=Marivirga aurantiaca TaxID=2802615 RepID=A0A935C585_9BACT|nr:alpha/beta hydrolase [Marivirga aurantiaca]MBK6263665.1 alpha/beta hydrolase [Marivirga aurantiaca]